MSTYLDYSKELSGIDPELVVGFLNWYSVSEDVFIDKNKFNQLTLDANIKIVPNEPKAGDVFKRACTAANKKSVWVNDRRFNLLVRDAGYDDDKIYRQIVEEEVDVNNHRLSYGITATITFDKKTSVIHHKHENLEYSPSRSVTNTAINEILDYFNKFNNCIDSQKIREMIRKNLEYEFRSIVVRPSGGIHFVNKASAEDNDLYRMANFVNQLDGCSLHVLPLLNTKGQKEMLKKAFEDESVKEASRLIGEIVELSNKGVKIQEKTKSKYLLEYKHLKEKLVEYSDTLQDKFEYAGSELEILQSQIKSIMEA